MDAFELAGSLFGAKRMEGSSNMRDYDTTIFGEAVSDSENGTVLVKLSDDVTTPDGSGDAYVELPTYVSVRSGDTVSVGVSTNGTIGDPRVSGVIGGGDRMQTQIDNAEALAQQAEAVATATGQHFWDSDDGAHVTQVTRDEWEDSSDPNYQSGPNSLWNSLGMLFRDGLTNLLAILTNGIAIYDGNGNNADNILAEFTASLIRIGGRLFGAGTSTASVQFFDATDSTTALNATRTISAPYGYNQSAANVARLDTTLDDSSLTYGDGVISPTAGVSSTCQVEHDNASNSHGEGVAALVAYTSDEGRGMASVSAVASRSRSPLGDGVDDYQMPYVELLGRRLKLDWYIGSTPYGEQFPMEDVARAIANASPEDAWYAVAASEWMTLASGWSITSSDLKYNAYRKRLVGRVYISTTASKSAGNNSLGTIGYWYRPPARVVIPSTTQSSYVIYADSSGASTIALVSAVSSGTTLYFAMDYSVA